MSQPDLIDSYLDRLVECLDGPGREIRRALIESEDHLRQGVSDAMETGATEEAAATSAIERFGTPEEVARRYRMLRSFATPAQILGQVVLCLVLVGSFVLISIGLSGVLAAAGSSLLGPAFIAGDGPGVIYTPERCEDFLGFHPEADSCEEAAILHHRDETVGYRLSAGVLGLLLLVGWWASRRAMRDSMGPWAVPSLFVPGTATALFAAAALLLGGLGIMQLMSTGLDGGAGAMLTAGFVSLLAMVLFGARLVGVLRYRPTD